MSLISRKLLALMCVAVLLASILSPGMGQSANRFTDVPGWGQEAVDYLVGNGSIVGYPDGSFRAHNELTRAEAVKILAISLGLDVSDHQKPAFADSRDHWASKYIAAFQTQKKSVITGYPDGTFRPNDSITRAELAKMMVAAYNLKLNEEAEVHFSDISGWAFNYINILGSLGIVAGRSEGKFAPSGNVTRVEMAAFVYRTEVETARLQVPKKKVFPAIKQVTVFNETKFEVTFSSALDEDLAAEIEYSGKRFIVYHAGQSARSSDAVQSQTISFNEDHTKAAVILEDDSIKADANYTVALMNGDNKTVADIVETFAPVMLKKGAEQPEVIVDGKQDKLILKFNEKMSNSALEARNYQIYENNRLSGGLEEYIVASDLSGDGLAKGDWADATEKTSIEFTLNKNIDSKKFNVKETYKILVSNRVETDKGAELSDVQRTIRIKTPTLSDAQPKAILARVVHNDLIVMFDKNLNKALINPILVVVKKPGGHTIPVANIELANEGNHLGDKEIKISVAEGYRLENDLAYTVDLPSNMVANAIFPHALNQEVTGLEAKAQKDIEITSVSAQFVRQSSHKDKADLLLTFDQRADLEELMAANSDEMIIKDEGSIYQWIDPKGLELYYGDPTGKTVMIEDVGSAFKLNGNTQERGFKPRYGKSYTVELKPNTVETENGIKTNQEKLVSSVTGISISAPELDKIFINSAEEIVIRFKEDIDAKNLQAHHITVQGYETYKNGNFTANPISLTGNSQLAFSVDENTLTLRPANSGVTFVTNAAANLFSIQGDSIKGERSGVENTRLTSTDHIDPVNIIDRALPIMIGAQKEETDSTITITYSEPVAFKGSDPEMQASQFAVEHATKNAYGLTASLVSPLAGFSPNLMITFNKPETFKPDLDLEKVKVIYTRNNHVLVRDMKENEQNPQTITGIKRGNDSQ